MLIPCRRVKVVVQLVRKMVVQGDRGTEVAGMVVYLALFTCGRVSA